MFSTYSRWKNIFKDGLFGAERSEFFVVALEKPIINLCVKNFFWHEAFLVLMLNFNAPDLQSTDTQIRITVSAVLYG